MFTPITITTLFTQLMIIYMGQPAPNNNGSLTGLIFEAISESYSQVQGVI